MNKQSGFTLFEILLAMSLSLLLLTVLIGLTKEIKKQYLFNQQFSETQNRVLWVLDFLRQKIQMAGNHYCQNGFSEGDNISLQGFTSENVPIVWGIFPVNNSDVIVVSGCDYYQGKEQWVQRIFFVADTYRQDDAHHPIYGLFTKVLGGQREEMASSINRLVIRYGIENLSAAQINNWKTIQSVQINLFTHSIYKHLLKEFPLYVTLRNLQK